MTNDGRTKGGWANYCQHCHKRYWVTDRDITKPKATRYTDETCQEKHECIG